jgi:hypothetical protein
MVHGFSDLGLKTGQLQFRNLTHKIIVSVYWFVPQNQVGDGLSVAPQNRRE